MNKVFWVLALAAIGLVLAAKPSQAVYIDRITHEPITTDHTKCVLTPNPAEKNATTVYTLNIDLTKRIESAYYEWWGRYGRCDELQYHAEHNTSIDRLNSWLSKTQIQRYKDHIYDGLIYTSDAKYWRLINGKRQRVYDWPTQMSWGFVSQDGRSVHHLHTNDFYSAYPEIAPLQYAQGPYASQVDDVWQNKNSNVNVPVRLKDELISKGLDFGYFKYRDACSQYQRGCGTSYDWNFLYSNSCLWNNNNPTCDE